MREAEDAEPDQHDPHPPVPVVHRRAGQEPQRQHGEDRVLQPGHDDGDRRCREHQLATNGSARDGRTAEKRQRHPGDERGDQRDAGRDGLGAALVVER